MYRIRPYFDDFDVQPTKIMYCLRSYHQSEAKKKSTKCEENTKNKKEGNEAQKECKQSSESSTKTAYCDQENEDEKELIGRLNTLSSRLDAFIAKQQSSSISNSTNTKNGRKSNKDVSATTSIEDKEVANIATSKGVSTDQRHQSSEATNVEKLLPNSPDAIHALLGPTSCAVFPIHDYGDLARQHVGQQIALHFRATDTAVIDMLKKVGLKRNIALVKEGEKVPADKLIIKLQSAEDFSIVRNDHEIRGEIEAWKFLGELFGLYLSADQKVSALTDQWLRLAASTDCIDTLSRKLSAHLGTLDFLSSQHAICLADLVLRSRFVDAQTGELTQCFDAKAANNVQLWIERIDNALTK